MSKSSILILVYIIGIILGAVFLDIWGAETTLLKALIGVLWTFIFVVSLFYFEKKENE